MGLLGLGAIHKYGESIVRQVIFQRVLETGNSFFILILSLFRCLFKSTLVRDSTQKVVGYVVIGKEFNKIVETAKQTHMDFLLLREIYSI
jgi:hypothetical protein